jgi:hypothetical protein
MIRYDIYDQQLSPGDLICWCTHNVINHGKIYKISSKGTLFIQPWDDEHQVYTLRTLVRTRAFNVIKITAIPKSR